MSGPLPQPQRSPPLSSEASRLTQADPSRPPPQTHPPLSGTSMVRLPRQSKPPLRLCFHISASPSG
eukprot:754899-Prorocentrum_minimum.AAC.2